MNSNNIVCNNSNNYNNNVFNNENNYNNNFVSKPSINLTYTNSKNTLNISKYPSSQIINLKNIGGDISSIVSSNTPIQNNIKFNQNLNNQLSENKIILNKYNMESDNNLNYSNKGKSSTDLTNICRNNFLSSNKISENNIYNQNNTVLNLPGTPIRVNIPDINNENNHNNSGIREGKSLCYNMNRFYDDKEIDRSKSPRLLNQNNVSHLSTNKGVIRNIESNV